MIRHSISVRASISFLAAAAVVLAASMAPGMAAVPDTVGLVDPVTGVWKLRTETGDIATFYYGDPGDRPMAGDWNCDGVDTPGLYRQSDGRVYLRNDNTQGPADIDFFFGDPGDIPLPGDFDGDGCDTVSLFRPSEGRVYVINELGSDQTGLGAADYAYYFGNPGDEPFAGDFDGDGTDTVGLYRQSTGFTYLRQTNTAGPADLSFFFGDPGDRFIAGDWNGDSIDTPGVFRGIGTTFYLKNTNAQGNADVAFSLGESDWLPIAGSWGDISAVTPLALELVASGLNQPLFLDAPRGDPRLFVLEKGGRIRVIENGSVLATPYLTVAVSTESERGLLGLAFHPDFAINGRFFVHFTNPSGTTRVVEYYADPAADTASPTPIATVLSVSQPAGNHNGGMIEFGPDGYLYVSLGDGGGSPGNRSQDINDPLGSILRLDVDAPSGDNGAPGNPYAGKPGDDRIWARGLRNPWRTTIDAETGKLIIADVGQGTREEVNIVPVAAPAVNYGWPVMEGSLCYPATSPCSSSDLHLPEVEYGRNEGQSITGGYVYRGSAMPTLAGRYFYGDFGSGFIRSFAFSGGLPYDHLDHTSELGKVSSLSSFGTDGFGELYVISLGGSVYRIVPDV